MCIELSELHDREVQLELELFQLNMKEDCHSDDSMYEMWKVNKQRSGPVAPDAV
jgi:hypothetical protein